MNSTTRSDHANPVSGRTLLTREEVAELLGISVITLDRWRKQGKGPLHIRLDAARGVRYRRESLEAWLAQREGFRTTKVATV
jgi:excisionase family DNA binding protein